MNPASRWLLACTVILLSACASKLFDKEYYIPTEVPLARLKFLPVERGSYGIEILHEERWLRMPGRVTARRTVTGMDASSSFNEFGEQNTEVVAGRIVTLALSYEGPPDAAAPPLACKLQVNLCAEEGVRYELALTPGANACELYFQKQFVSEAGVVRTEKLSAEAAATCAAPKA